MPYFSNMSLRASAHTGVAIRIPQRRTKILVSAKENGLPHQ